MKLRTRLALGLAASVAVVSLTDLTHDAPSAVMSVEAVRDAVNLRDTLRKRVEYWRDRKRVREVDFEEGGDMEGDEGLLES